MKRVKKTNKNPKCELCDEVGHKAKTFYPDPYSRAYIMCKNLGPTFKYPLVWDY